jgi:putative DNA primase/helicase
MRQKTKEAAYGKWGSILGHLGYGDLLDGKHQDCPLCGSKKKFRYTDYKSHGDWICTCKSGDGFDLVMESEGLGFDQAAKTIDGIIGNNDLEETFKPEIDYEKRRNNLNKLWAGATDRQLVVDYLIGRGIMMPGGNGFKGLKDLRGHPAMFNNDSGNMHQAGMCALIRNKSGTPVSIHRTFFDPKAKKIMPPTEKIAGAGVRLGWDNTPDFQTDETIIIGEGIETTIAGMAHAQAPGLAAISAHGMETIIVPKRFERVIILADNDRSFTGQKAAFTLARRLDTEKRDVRVIMSDQKQHDFLDHNRKTGKLLEWRND